MALSGVLIFSSDAYLALGSIAVSPSGPDVLAPFLSHANVDVRRGAANALLVAAQRGHSRAYFWLTNALAGEHDIALRSTLTSFVRDLDATNLAAIGTLRRLQTFTNAEVAAWASNYLRELKTNR